MSGPFGNAGLGYELYDRIGSGYSQARRPDRRLEQAIWAALGDAATVLNVGAGAGAYEPPDREVTALEPSDVMIAQRPPGAAPVVQGRAEDLPFGDDAFDAAMAVLSDHHWSDRGRGLREMRRVAHERVVLFSANPAEADLFWMTTDYLPEFLGLIQPRYRRPGAWEDDLRAALGPLDLTPVPIPYDCADGFYGAHWRRPEAFLHPEVRRSISVFAQISSGAVDRAIDSLGADLETGRWHERHRELLKMDELHLGYYVITAEPTQTGGRT